MKYILIVLLSLFSLGYAKENLVLTSNFYDRDGSFDIILTFDEPYTDNIIYAKDNNIATIKLNNANILKNKKEIYNNNFLRKIEVVNKGKNGYINIQLRKRRDINIVQTEDKYGLKISIIKLSSDSVREMPLKFNQTKGISIISVNDTDPSNRVLGGIKKTDLSTPMLDNNKNKVKVTQVASNDVKIMNNDYTNTSINRSNNNESKNSNALAIAGLKSSNIPTSSYVISILIVIIGLIALFIINRKKVKNKDSSWLSNLKKVKNSKKNSEKPTVNSETTFNINENVESKTQSSEDGITEVVHNGFKYILYKEENGNTTLLDKVPVNKDSSKYSKNSNSRKNLNYAEKILNNTK